MIEIKNKAIKQSIKCFKRYEIENWEISRPLAHRNFMQDLKKALHAQEIKVKDKAIKQAMQRFKLYGMDDWEDWEDSYPSIFQTFMQNMNKALRKDLKL